MLLTFCPTPHQNSHSFPSPRSCTCFSLCNLSNHSTGTIWLTSTGHMGHNTGVEQAILMFLGIPTRLSGSCTEMGTPLIIFTTRGMTIIINRDFTKCDLLSPPYMNFTYYLNLPHLVDFFTTHTMDLSSGWHGELQLLKLYTHVTQSNKKHAIELQNSKSQICTKICHTYLSSALLLKWKRKQEKIYYCRHRYTYIHGNIIFLQMHNDPKEWFYSPSDHDRTFCSAKQNTIC